MVECSSSCVLCLEGSSTLLFIIGVRWCVCLYLAQSTCSTAFYMPSCHRQMKKRLSGAKWGWLTLDRTLSPPPSRGGLLSGCGLLLGWSFTQITLSDGPFHLFFAHVCFALHRKAPSWCIFHVFVFMCCKIIISKYMWNLVNGECICV